MEALKVCLEDPPVSTKDKALKERNFNVVLDVLTRFRAADVEKAVKSLSSEQVDVLMKYIYRGFASPTENSCGILLSWHDKAVTAGGLGSIVRVLTDRKSV
ncbi:Actin-related protein 2/3 complex subunit 5 [Geodia barretti]|nr:Actin-related protein 2/3 complex subunit 5 [Geodia barretti]